MPQGLGELRNRTENKRGERTVLDLINDWHIIISSFGHPSMKSGLGFIPSLLILLFFKKVSLAILDIVSAHAWNPSLRNSGNIHSLFFAQDDSVTITTILDVKYNYTLCHLLDNALYVFYTFI